MRYSFHGKVRSTGQQVDGFVEAANSTEAIDRLADQGIIGVYSVRAEPKPPKNPVSLAGQAEPDGEAARLPGPTVIQQTSLSAGSEAVLSQLMDKVSLLVLQVEKLLARPAQVVYQSGGSGRGEGGGSKRKGRAVTEVQNSTLKDIFQNNLDLRRSLSKLATTVGPSPVRPIDSAPREMPGMREARENAKVASRELQSQPAA